MQKSLVSRRGSADATASSRIRLEVARLRMPLLQAHQPVEVDDQRAGGGGEFRQVLPAPVHTRQHRPVAPHREHGQLSGQSRLRHQLGRDTHTTRGTTARTRRHGPVARDTTRQRQRVGDHQLGERLMARVGSCLAQMQSAAPAQSRAQRQLARAATRPAACASADTRCTCPRHGRESTRRSPGRPQAPHPQQTRRRHGQRRYEQRRYERRRP